MGKLRQAVLGHPLTMRRLIAHEVGEQDRDWFDGCRLDQLHAAPAGRFEAGRCALLFLIAAPSYPVLALAIPLCALLLIGGLSGLHRARANGVSPQQMLRLWGGYLVLRALLMGSLGAVLVTSVAPDRLIPLIMLIALSNSMDSFAQYTVPVVGTASGWISCIALAVPLSLRPETGMTLVLLVSLLQLMTVHMRMFNLNYLFSTRRLRTRKLQDANETIQLLLNQYDEHGSDWLVETDAQGFILKPSERLCRSTGKSAAELEGLKLTALFEAGPQLDALRRAARRMKPFRDMPVGIAVAGEMRWWSISGCPVFARDGQHRGFRGFVRDVTDRYLAENKVLYLAHHDPLTRLANRAEFQARLDQHLAAAPRGGQAALLFVDLDNFKLINDSMGHATGDRVLAEAASRLSQRVSARDLVARLGGDEFAVLLRRPRSPAAVMELAQAIVRDIGLPMEADGRILQVGASIGVAMAPDHAGEGEGLLRAADMALYDAKAQGRGQASLYNAGMKEELFERRALEIDMRGALAAGQFTLHYQPLHRLDTDEIAGFEALLRWNHPTRGMIEPGRFIPVAEESGLILQIGEWVLREALAEASTWPEHLTVAVNVSAAQMRGGELLRQVVALSSTGFDPCRLELEITETMLMEDSQVHLRLLHRLRALGVRIALDDFGTGYSSLNYLRSFPFDKIKIDRCFVTDIASSDDSGAIVEAVLGLAARLNMQTIAEGVEDEEQLARLRARGCEQVQGYLFSKALPPEQLPITRLGVKDPVALPPAPTPELHRRGLRPCPTGALLAQGGSAAMRLDCGDCVAC
ncbi:EAL domain-containing protein [Novosphingobium sp. KCTC 2891]|nr:EAL domain-containing protein [Novosphingobium sp. KCTC 2891]